ncbi:hypothetical protein C5E16_16000 [Clavibacter michiganensis]|uniref:Uncharacterized protein n=1 Tax=Clavibacter michiganensis TaxID=28447 RepID=A0A2S5VIA5_9MICO|nr:hypothetical protein C5E16_16000 [Clavibacter michiganensis]
MTATPSTSQAYLLVVAAGVQRAVDAVRRCPTAAVPAMTGAGVAVNGASAAVARRIRIIDAALGVTGTSSDATTTRVGTLAASAASAVGSTATSSATPRLSPVTAATSRARADAGRALRAAARRTAEWCSPNVIPPDRRGPLRLVWK